MKKIITQISPGNPALAFIENQIIDNNYRETYVSQYDYYPARYIRTILRLLDQSAPNSSLLYIRDTDIIENLKNTLKEVVKAQYHTTNQETKSRKLTTVYKNILVSCRKMEFINCYDKNQNAIESLSGNNVKYITLTHLGKKLITETDSFNRSFIFSKGMDFLLDGWINSLLELFRNGDQKLNRISQLEFMFFVSIINQQTSFRIHQEQCRSLINNFRCLSRIQKSEVGKIVENLLSKKIFLQWQDATLRFFAIIKHSVYFQQNETNLYLCEKFR
jgi:hypothetical protein